MKDKKLWIIVGVVLLVGVGLWGYNESKSKVQFRTNIENHYQQEFVTLLDVVKDMDTKLSKVFVSNDSKFLTKSLYEIRRLASNAEETLSKLPISHQSLKETSTFVNKLGDYSNYLAEKCLDGQTLTKDEQDTLYKMSRSSNSLLSQLQSFNTKISKDSDYKWGRDDLTYYLDNNSENLADVSFGDINTQFVDYPTMIYDGPFSDHLKTNDPKGLSKDKVMTESQVRNRLVQSLKKNGFSNAVVKYTGETKGDIPVYVYKVKDGDKTIRMEYTQKGGHLYSANPSFSPASAKISMKEAQKKAAAYLQNIGIHSMVPSYYESYNNIGVFNFAYSDNGVLCYSDLIKVQVSLEDGSVIGYEAQGYYMCHTNRNITKPKLSTEQAKKKLSKNIKVTSQRLAVIPTESTKEKLCYEFKGTYDDKWYIIYVDAQTGAEVQIFEIIEADESVLVL